MLPAFSASNDNAAKIATFKVMGSINIQHHKIREIGGDRSVSGGYGDGCGYSSMT